LFHRVVCQKGENAYDCDENSKEKAPIECYCNSKKWMPMDMIYTQCANKYNIISSFECPQIIIITIELRARKGHLNVQI